MRLAGRGGLQPGVDGEIVVLGGVNGPGDGPQTFALRPDSVYCIKSVGLTLAASGAVANRIVFIQAAAQNRRLWDYGSTVAVTAGQTIFFSFGPSGRVSNATGSRQWIAVPEMWVPTDGALSILADSGDPADVYSGLTCVALRYPGVA